jgi:hypothetical protein
MNDDVAVRAVVVEATRDVSQAVRSTEPFVIPAPAHFEQVFVFAAFPNRVDRCGVGRGVDNPNRTPRREFSQVPAEVRLNDYFDGVVVPREAAPAHDPYPNRMLTEVSS